MMLRLSKLNGTFCTRIAVLIILIWTVIVYRSYTVNTPITIKKTPGIVFILQWTSSHTEPFTFMGHGVETFLRRKCPVFTCYVTASPDLLGDITNFDVLLFHAKEVIHDTQEFKLPDKRTSHQRYVFASMESSGYYPVKTEKINGYFNLTWTYKLDSDINFGYFAIRNNKGELIGPREDMHWLVQDEMLPINQTIRNKLSTKRKAVAWFVSNCDAPSKRQDAVLDIETVMKKYGMTLDIYGYCGSKKCARSSMTDCLDLIEKDYYFYFAFENSFAEDYVTEKLLHALNHYAIPVVFGGANYTRFMPDGAYLDAIALGPKELVRQMLEITLDQERYYEFFKWRNHYSYHELSESPDTDPYCKLCEYLNRMEKERKSSVVKDLQKWWNPHGDQWTYLKSNSSVE